MSKFLSFMRVAAVIILPPAAAAMIISFGATCLLRYLYLLIGAETQFGVIFSQIRDAEMTMPLFRVFLICVVYWFSARYFGWKHKKIRFLLAAAGILVFLAAFVIAVLLTKVNGIGFGGVLFSLLRLLETAGENGLF